MRTAILLGLCLLPLGGLAHAQGASSASPGTVTVYRCTDASGRLSLRDTPCPGGQQQQARDMLRPKDAPARPASAPTSKPALPAPASAPAAEARTVYLAPPRPMYECTTPDGEVYTSETGDGNPRWVPLWTLGYPVLRSGTSLGNNIGGRPPRPDMPMRPPPHMTHWPVATGGGQWIRDACALLPPRETCARLRDRRDAIRTRFFNAQESERARLRVEERGINARLDNDCNRP